MKLTTKDDIEAPIAFVYAQLTDFESWERAALRRGAEVHRTDTLKKPGPGMAWKAAFDYRAKPRKMTLRLETMEEPGQIGFSANSPNISGTLDMTLVELAAMRTRVTVTLEVKPRTLISRLFLQSLALAKARVQGRFKARVAQAGTEIEERFAQARARG